MGSLLYLFSLHFIFLTPPPTGYTIETMSSTKYTCTGYSLPIVSHARYSTLQIDYIVYTLCRSTWHDITGLYYTERGLTCTIYSMIRFLLGTTYGIYHRIDDRWSMGTMTRVNLKRPYWLAVASEDKINKTYYNLAKPTLL